jgi:hypothetical protein
VSAQDAFHCHTHLGSNAFLLLPVNACVLLDRLREVPSDGPKRLIAEYRDGTVVRPERVVEGNLVLSQTQLLTAGWLRASPAPARSAPRSLAPS